jgi:hypothetical protein
MSHADYQSQYDEAFSWPRCEPEPPRFCDLSAQEQREAIEEWWTQKTYQEGLLGEAVNEHRLYPQIRAAFVAGNTAELGRLVDQAVREYCGEVMELDQ